MTIMERLEQHAAQGTRPHLEWQWDKGLVIHAGSIRTQQQAAEMTDLLAYFAGKLPEHGDVDDSAYVDPVDGEQPPPRRGRRPAEPAGG